MPRTLGHVFFIFYLERLKLHPRQCLTSDVGFGELTVLVSWDNGEGLLMCGFDGLIMLGSIRATIDFGYSIGWD